MIKKLLRQIVVFLRKKIIRTLCNFRSASRVFKSKFAETKRVRLDFTELFVQHAVGICMHVVRSYFTETDDLKQFFRKQRSFKKRSRR